MRSTEVTAVRIALVTDTYTPQVNRVTTVVQRIARLLRVAGHAAAVVAPRYPDHAAGNGTDELRIPSLPFPPYPSVRLSLPFGHGVDSYLARFAPDARPRPSDAYGRPLALIELPDPFSFPSGHTAAATAVATTVALHVPLLTPVLLPLAAAVAVSRVKLRVHDVADVLAGAGLGLTGAIIATLLVQRS